MRESMVIFVAKVFTFLNHWTSEAFCDGYVPQEEGDLIEPHWANRKPPSGLLFQACREFSMHVHSDLSLMELPIVEVSVLSGFRLHRKLLFCPYEMRRMWDICHLSLVQSGYLETTSIFGLLFRFN